MEGEVYPLPHLPPLHLPPVQQVRPAGRGQLGRSTSEQGKYIVRGDVLSYEERLREYRFVITKPRPSAGCRLAVAGISHYAGYLCALLAAA